jgi:hypothetical protein
LINSVFYSLSDAAYLADLFIMLMISIYHSYEFRDISLFIQISNKIPLILYNKTYHAK